MAVSPKFLIYKCMDPACPAKERVHLRIMLFGKITPVVIGAPTEQEAREKAQTFWDDQMSKARSNAKGGRGKPSNTIISTEDLTAIDAGS